MKRLVLFATLITLIGCGGSGAPGLNPFIGAWTGTYNIPATLEAGTSFFTVAADGTVSGSVFYPALSANATLSGTMNSSGQMTSTLDGAVTGTLNGTFSIAGNGHMTGALVQTLTGSAATTANYDMSPALPMRPR